MFNLIVSVFQPMTTSTLSFQYYPRYAENIRKRFEEISQYLTEFKPGKVQG